MTATAIERDLLALEKRGYVQAGPFTPEVTIEHPNVLRALHEEFVHAGAEVLQVLAFYASENKLAQIGYANRLGEVNRAAVRIAREVHDANEEARPIQRGGHHQLPR